MSISVAGSPTGLLEAIMGLVWRGKVWISLGILVGIAVALVAASQTTKVYSAQVILQPVSSRGAGLSGVLSQVGGLGSLVGLGMAGEDSANSSLASLRGPAFTARFIERRGLPQLIAADRWNSSSKSWNGPAPTQIELVRIFDGGIRTVAEDRRTGLVTVRIHWHNPAQAAEILTWMVSDLNAELRAKSLQEHRQSLEFLQQELQRTSSVELRQTIFGLMESHLKQVVLANARTDFALQIIDGPLMPTERDYVWPRRVLMAAVGLLAGGLVGLFVAMLAERRRVRALRIPRE